MRFRSLAALSATATLVVAAPAAARAATTLTPIPGSPFTTIGSPPGYGQGPTGLAYSGDGSLLTTANGDGSISEFSAAANGTLVQQAGAYIGPYQPAYTAAWNPAGTVLAIGYLPGPKQGAIAVYTRAPGTTSLSPGQTVNSGGDLRFAFSPDGEYLATTTLLTGAPHGQGGFVVWKVAADGTLTQVAARNLNNVPEAVAFSPNGRDLAIGDAGTDKVNVFKVGTFSKIPGSPFTVRFQSTNLAYSPDGTMLAGSYVNSNTVSLASVSARGTLKPGASANAGGSVQDIAWSPSGTLLAGSTGNGTDAVFAVQAGTLSPIKGSPFTIAQSVGQLQFSPDGKYLATAADNDASGSSSSEVSVLKVH
jgi:hypothetical protein